MPASSDETKSSAAVADDSKGKEDGDEPSAKDKLAKAEREVENNRLELKIAQAEAEASARKSQDEVDEKEHALQEATSALDQFMKNERELELSKVKLGLDRATWRLEAEKQELAELEAMYQKDDVATLTKELVLQRGRKGVEFAERDLGHEQREASATREFELPKKQRALEQEKREKENALREAKAEKQKSADEIELKLRKARAELEDAEKALTKAREKAAKT
jgi:hypothetical protein